jgi:hypothetical protein
MKCGFIERGSTYNPVLPHLKETERQAGFKVGINPTSYSLY